MSPRTVSVYSLNKLYDDFSMSNKLGGSGRTQRLQNAVYSKLPGGELKERSGAKRKPMILYFFVF